jgi:WD40 repeat protein
MSGREQLVARLDALAKTDDGWLQRCSRVLANRPAQLDDLLTELDPDTAAFQVGQSLPSGVALGPVTDHDDSLALKAARGVLAVARALAAGDDRDHGLEAAGEYWRQANLAPCPGGGAMPGSLFAQDDAALRAVLHRLDVLEDGASTLTAVVALALAGELKTSALSVRAPVLFDRGHEGADALLTLTLLPGGPPGLYPDPQRMMFMVTDSDFRVALDRAWGLAPASLYGLCVLWTITADDLACLDVTQGSLAASFVVALHELERRMRRLSALRLRLNGHCAATATLDRDGQLRPVTGYRRKLEAAADARLRVVVHKESASEIKPIAKGLGVKVSFVADLSGLLSHTRHRLNPLLAVITALLMITITLAGYAVVKDRAVGGKEREVISRTLAARSIAVGDTDPTLSQLLSVAAWRVNPSSEAHASLVNALLRQSAGVLPDAATYARTIALSPDGKLLATSSSKQSSVQLWSVATRQQMGTLPLDRGETGEALAFSPNGSLLAVGETGGHVRLWNMTSRQAVRSEMTCEDLCYAIKFSPDGRNLATGGFSSIRLWDVSTNRPVARPLTGQTSGIYTMSFSPDGATLVSGSGDGRVWLWRIGNKSKISGSQIEGKNVLLARSPPEQRGAAGACAFSPDGKTLAIGYRNGTIHLWNVAERQRLGAPLNSKSGLITELAFTASGRGLVSVGGSGTAQLWNVADHTIIDTLLSRTGETRDAVLGPDRRSLAVEGEDGKVRLWDLGLGHQLDAPLRLGPNQVMSLTYSPDDTKIAAGGYNYVVQFWNTANYAKIGTPLIHGTPIVATAFSPNGRLLATGDWDDENAVRLWDTKAFKLSAQLAGSSGATPVFSADGKTLAYTLENGGVGLWNITSNRLVKVLAKNSHDVKVLAFDLGGTRLFTYKEGRFTVWNIKKSSANQTFTVPADASQLAVSNDGHLFSVSAGQNGEQTVAVRRTADGGQVALTPLTGPADVSALVFSPDGSAVTSGGSDGSARIFDVVGKREVTTLTGTQSDPVMSIAYSHDGTTLAAGFFHGLIRLWGVTPLSKPDARVCRRAGRDLTSAEWQSNVKGLAYQKVCPS